MCHEFGVWISIRDNCTISVHFTDTTEAGTTEGFKKNKLACSETIKFVKNTCHTLVRVP